MTTQKCDICNKDFDDELILPLCNHCCKVMIIELPKLHETMEIITSEARKLNEIYDKYHGWNTPPWPSEEFKKEFDIKDEIITTKLSKSIEDMEKYQKYFWDMFWM